MKHFRELDADLINQMPNLKPKTDPMSERVARIFFSGRIREGLTQQQQQQLADKAEADIKTIHRIEGGGGGISDAIYEKVFQALNKEKQ